MSLVNRSIPNLYNGVSQQPASLRLSSQAEEQINGLSSVVSGVDKRPPSKHVSKINSLTTEEAYIHTINRDVNNQYVVVVVDGDLYVYDIDGTAQTVNFPDGKTYLSATNPLEDFAAITVADYTFIVNKTIAVTKDAAVSGGTFKGTKQKFLDLPTSGLSDGDVWEIAGDASNNFDNYYVKYVSADAVWRETLKPGINTTLTASTMPYQLVNDGGGSFTLSEIAWEDRLIGDDDTAPFPSFLDNFIFDVFFHRNRLGFISGENVIFSRSGDFFNFFPQTTTLVLDTDPVDTAVSHTKVAVLKHSLAFNTSLMLFADQAQFQLTAGDVLTPKSTTINVTTEFNIEPKVKPTSASTSLYFATTKGSYSSIKEYSVQPLTYINDASDVTAHVPEYLPPNLYKLAGSNLVDTIIGLSTDERTTIYVYRYYWASPEEKVQSSWSKFTLADDSTILNADFIDTKLYMVIGRSDGMYIEYLDFQPANDTDMDYVVKLDSRVEATGVYDSGTNETTWTMPYPITGEHRVTLGSTFTGEASTELVLTNSGANTVSVTGDYSSGLAYVGKPYMYKYTFSPIYFKDENRISVPHYTIKIKNFKLLFNDTGSFEVTVTPKNRETQTYTYSGKRVGDSGMIIGQVNIDSGVFPFPVFSDASTSVISLTNSSSLPCSFQAAEWEGLLTSRSKHV